MKLPAIPVLKVAHPGLGVPQAIETVGGSRVKIEGLDTGIGYNCGVGGAGLFFFIFGSDVTGAQDAPLSNGYKTKPTGSRRLS